jgi:GNAT superfamily N-acetyltransferase
VQSFAKATQSAFPEDTQFTVKVRRIEYSEFDGNDEILSEQATVQTRFVKGGMTGEITRQFYRDKGGDLVAKHASFVINGDGQGEGIGKRALKAQFDEYERMGVAKVKVHANIDVGGYAWARFGFVPTQSSWDALRTSMKTWVNSDKALRDIFGNDYQPLNIPQRQRRALTKILDNPDPKGIWKIADARYRDRNLGKEILMERDWEGEIRLSDADAMARFNHYVGRSK